MVEDSNKAMFESASPTAGAAPARAWESATHTESHRADQKDRRRPFSLQRTWYLDRLTLIDAFAFYRGVNDAHYRRQRIVLL